MTSSSNNDPSQLIELESPGDGQEIADGDIGWDQLRRKEGDTSGDFSLSPDGDGPGGFEDLLNFDFNEAEAVDRSGLRALINQSVVAHQKMPVLDLILDRMARRMSTSIRQLTDENVDVSLEDVDTIRFADFCANQSARAVIGILRSEALQAQALVVTDNSFVIAIVDLLLGGRRGTLSMPTEERAFTAIELGLAEMLLKSMITDLNDAFAPIVNAGFVLERIETSARFASIMQESSVAVRAKLKVRLGENKTFASLIIPNADLESIRGDLTREFMGDVQTRRETWQRKLGEGISVAETDLIAVIGEKSLAISEINNWEVGATLTFSSTPKTAAQLRVGDVTVARGHVGKIGEQLAVKLVPEGQATPARRFDPADAPVSDQPTGDPVQDSNSTAQR
ncbi:MAG: FliM/FliN family flagellar motor switch protein [Pseudomonadota bacterium]